MASFARVGAKLISGQMAVAVAMARGLVVDGRIARGATKAVAALRSAKAVTTKVLMVGFLWDGASVSPLPCSKVVAFISGTSHGDCAGFAGDVVQQHKKMKRVRSQNVKSEFTVRT